MHGGEKGSEFIMVSAELPALMDVPSAYKTEAYRKAHAEFKIRMESLLQKPGALGVANDILIDVDNETNKPTLYLLAAQLKTPNLVTLATPKTNG